MNIDFRKFSKSIKEQQGFSLVELMISLTLGLIITGVVVQIFSSSRTTYDLEEGLAEVQEQGRFAMEFLAQDIRQAGNFGCARLDKKYVSNIVRNPDGPRESLTDPYNPASTRPVGLVMYEYTGAGGTALNDWTPNLPGNGYFDTLLPPGPTLIPFSDVVLIQYATSMNVQLVNPGGPINANLKVVRTPTTTGAFQKDDVVMISDCRRADVFRITNNPASGGGPTITLTHASSTNTQNTLNNSYGSSADVMKLATRGYFVGVSIPAIAPAPGVTPEPALYRMALDNNNWRPEPLVEGVEQLKLLIGIDATSPSTSDNNSLSETYVTSTEMLAFASPTPRDMSSVVDVKVGLIVRSSNMIDVQGVKENIVIAETNIPIFGINNQIYRFTPAPPAGTFDPELYRRRRLFTMTINKRNK